VKKRVQLVETTPSGIDGEGLASLDAAVFKLGKSIDGAALPSAIPVSGDLAGPQGTMSSLCIIGFPFPPEQTSGKVGIVDWDWVTGTLFGNRFGLKRLSPGIACRPIGSITGDSRPWVFGHDATTLGGNSGSPVLAWRDADFAGFGLHFGGRTVDTNVAHAIGQCKEPLRKIGVPVADPARNDIAGEAPLLTEGLVADGIAELVRRGVIDVDDFRRAYNAAKAPTNPLFAVFEVQAGGDVAAIPLAVKQAWGKFCVTLVERLSLLVSNEALENEDLRRIVRSLGAQAPGRIQSILRKQALGSVRTLPLLIRSARATALIQATNPRERASVYGTGFLVGPDLVLTAAHVVAPLMDGDVPRVGSERDATIEFFNQLEGVGMWPVRCRLRPSPEWLISKSAQDGTGTLMGGNSPEQTANSLDYALIRLTEPVGSAIGVVDIDEPPDPRKSDRLTVIGYGGGSECLYDDHVVDEHDAVSHRIHHEVSTVDGMSGGPCLDGDGRAVAIHEGSIRVAVPPYNRSVALCAIRACMRSEGGGDPLALRPGPLWGLHSMGARSAWRSYGATLPDVSEADRASWRDFVDALDPRDEFHPVFGRIDFQNWIDMASLSNSTSRVAFLSGDKGVGLSFLAEILKARVGVSRAPVIVVSPELVRTESIIGVLNAVLREAGAKHANLDLPPTRPRDGVLNNDVIPDVLSLFNKLLRAKNATSFWLFVDVGEDGNLTADKMADWKQLISAAESPTWLRVVMVGIKNAHRKEFASVLSSRTTAYSQFLAAINSDDFEMTVGKIASSHDLSEAKYRDYAVNVWDENIAMLAQSRRVAEAVRLALIIRTQMNSSKGAENGG
jgi:V8-like Glu-specific endopeptidase